MMIVAFITAAASLALAVVTWQWLTLRATVRQRGLLRRWPIRRITVAELDPVFAPDAMGPTFATEVRFLGRGNMVVPGGTSDTEAWILAVLAKGAERMFEFGTCTGKTAYLWATNQPENGRVATLTLTPDQVGEYAAEDGDDTRATAYALGESAFRTFRYTGTAAESRIEQLYGDSKAFDDGPHRERYDVVFVDGSHARSYVRSDSAKALRMVKPGGIVLWHDYGPGVPGVFRVLNQLALTLPLVHVTGTALVCYRRPGQPGV